VSEPIKVGDLVMIVRTCCEFPLTEGVRMGLPWRVDVMANLKRSRCPKCGFTDSGSYAGSKDIVRPNWNCAPLEWLKKIDPPKLEQDERHDEKITA